MRIGVLLKVRNVRGAGERLRSAGVGGITLTLEPASIRNLVFLCASLTKNRRLEVGPVALVAAKSGLLFSGLLALFSSFTKLFVVPTEGVHVGRSWTVGAVTSRAALPTMRVVVCDGGYQVREACDFCFELLYFGGGSRGGGNSRWGDDFYDFVRHICQLGKISCSISGG